MILRIDMNGDIPIYQQIRNQIVFGVAKGDMNPGDSLPTVRQLASEICVNPMTVNKAYALLKEEGVILIDRRHGAQINDFGIQKNPFDIDFDQKLKLLVSEARIKGAEKEDIKKHILDIIDIVYE